ncbi:MAG: VCBS repeat-containing protein, partial [Deltaproteobacteria bacterium]|nr:VCBS repeat-containing protein [Deltaproteobacteria bacterium]
MRTLLGASGTLLLVLCACKDLPQLQAGVCGNGVIEQGEDCDSVASPGMRCLGAGEASPCRLTCRLPADAGPGAASPRCPERWGCGLDGLCRQSAGDFVPTGSPIVAGAWSVAAGDFDGDGRRDLLTCGATGLIDKARGRVHFFDSGGTLAATRVLSVPMISPVVVDVDGDGKDDLVSGVDGLLTWRGTADRELLPVAAPTFQIDGKALRLVPVSIPLNPTEFLVVLERGAEVALAEPGRDELPLAEVAGEEGRPLVLVGQPATGRFVESSNAGEGFVLAFSGEHRVRVFQPCALSSSGERVWMPGLGQVDVAVG